MLQLDRITQNPQVMGGKACVRGMRVTVGMVVGQIGAGHSVEEVLAARTRRTTPSMPKPCNRSETMNIRPIRTEADNIAALAEISALMDLDPELGTPEGDRLDVLVTLVQAFEAKQYPMPRPDPVEAIKFRMEQQGLTARDLEPIIGSRGRVSEVLNRKRPLTMAMVWRLHTELGIPAESLIGPPRRAEA